MTDGILENILNQEDSGIQDGRAVSQGEPGSLRKAGPRTSPGLGTADFP